MRDAIERKTTGEKVAFLEIGGEKRCLFFDAIELIDHCAFFGEVTE